MRRIVSYAAIDRLKRMSSFEVRKNVNQNRYTRRQEQRRKIDSLVGSEDLEVGRREPTADEVLQMQKGIENNKTSEFGLLRLSTIKLNISYFMGDEDRPCSLLRYAISHGRDKIAMSLIRAGAWPHAQGTFESNYDICKTFRELHPQYAVWLMVFEYARRCPPSICEICSIGLSDCVKFDKCDHKVCISCFWSCVGDLDGLKYELSDLLSNLTVWNGILESSVCCLSCGNQVCQEPTQFTRPNGLLQLPALECKRESHELFRLLPTSHLCGIEKVEKFSDGKFKKGKALRGMHLSELAQCSPGTTQSQRQEEFVKACMKPDLRRVAALIEVGVHLDGVDEYGMTTLMQAAWLGHSYVCALLLAVGADLDIQDPLGHTALSIATRTKNTAIIDLLARVQGATNAPEYKDTVIFTQRDIVSANERGLPRGLQSCYQEHYAFAGVARNTYTPDHQYGKEPILSVLIPPLSSSPIQESVRAFWRDHGVKGAEPGAFCLDHCFDNVFLQSLVDVFARLPVAPSEKSHCASRSYFCDVEGRVTQLLEHFVALARKVCSLESCQGTSTNAINLGCANSADSTAFAGNCVKVFPQMRFLHYEEEGTALAPHVDLARRDARDVRMKSTHTFILYLSDCDAGGGETVLLKSLCKKVNATPAIAATGSNVCSTSCAVEDENSIAAVSPRRGRLLLFPHNCPHEGRAISHKDPKLLLRGEVYIG